MRDIAPEIAAVAAKYKYKQTPDFVVEIQQQVDNVWRGFTEFIYEFILRRQPGITDTNAVGNILQAFVILVGIVCLIAVVLLVMKRLGQLSDQANLAKKGQSAAYKLLDANGWKTEAESFAANLEWREACRALYMASLRTLHEASIVEFAPTRTNYEYWYMLAPKTELLAKNFKSLANHIESLWFGSQMASSEDYAHCLAQLKLVESECQQEKERKAREIADKR